MVDIGPNAVSETGRTAADRDAARGTPPSRDDRTGMVAVWALVGAVAAVIALQAWGRWIFSDEFAPAPVRGPDVFRQWQLIVLRIVEVSSVSLVAWSAWRYVVKPLWRDRALDLDGRLFVGCFITGATDCILDLHEYIFAWNSHAINMGSWSSFLPFHSSGSSSRYAEGLAWGLPMYIYTLFLVAILGCKVVIFLRKRVPDISNATALIIFWFVYFMLDFVGEVVFIRATQAYIFAKTNGDLTLWGGTLYQFPLYEPFLCATFAVMFAGMRLSALDSDDGVSFIERGFHRFNPRLHGLIRLLAVTGFSVLMLVGIYHIWFNWLSLTGESFAPLPSYFLPG